MFRKSLELTKTRQVVPGVSVASQGKRSTGLVVIMVAAADVAVTKRAVNVGMEIRHVDTKAKGMDMGGVEDQKRKGGEEEVVERVGKRA